MHLLSRQLLPVVILVLYPPIRDAGSYPWSERVLLLDSVTAVVPIGNSRSASSRGGLVNVFARSFNVLEAGGCCTDSTVPGKHRAVVCRGCLRFLFWSSIATVRHSDIYRAIPTWVPRLPMLHFGDRKGVQLLRMGWLVHNPLTMRIWATRRQGVGADRMVKRGPDATFWGVHGEFGTTLIIKPAS